MTQTELTNLSQEAINTVLTVLPDMSLAEMVVYVREYCLTCGYQVFIRISEQNIVIIQF